MPDTPDNNTVPQKPDQPDAFDQALADLAKMVQPLSPDSGLQGLVYLYYLLSLWASFKIYQVEPYLGPSELAGHEKGGVNIITLPNGRKIHDYGYYLMTSNGEDYGSACTGKLVETTQEMVSLFKQRGAEIVSFGGYDLAKRVAWIACVELEIEVSNYYPNDADWEALARVRALHEAAGKKLLKKTKAAADDRRPE